MSNEIIIDEPGLYELRNGRTARIICATENPLPGAYEWRGNLIEDDDQTIRKMDVGWYSTGRFLFMVSESNNDIIRKKSSSVISRRISGEQRWMAEI